MKVNVQYAETHFAELASSAARGEEVEIAQPDGPTLKLVVSPPPAAPAKKAGKRILGAGVGEMIVPSFEEWQAMDNDLAQLINDSPLFPAEKR
jgi:antitoxin (DNA-binding transcriptional repressor) of toxin-antitoxin stability system